jgi:hypothetical protein
MLILIGGGAAVLFPTPGRMLNEFDPVTTTPDAMVLHYLYTD